MKNIQVIDGALNAVYDIFAATDEGCDVVFADEVYPTRRDEEAKNPDGTDLR